MKYIHVYAQLPVMAHLHVPADEKTRLISRHRTTPRGIHNALAKTSRLSREYVQTHGNMAAHRVWLSYDGRILDKTFLGAMLDGFTDFTASYDSIARSYC